MEYQTQCTQIKGTCDEHVAMALAYLAGWKNCRITRRTEVVGACLSMENWDEDVKQLANYLLGKIPSDTHVIEEVAVFHEDTVAKCGDELFAAQPDFIVSKLPEEYYIIEFNERVERALIGKIGEEIKIAYLQQ